MCRKKMKRGRGSGPGFFVSRGYVRASTQPLPVATIPPRVHKEHTGNRRKARTQKQGQVVLHLVKLQDEDLVRIAED
jgi:hypothetical protein